MWSFGRVGVEKLKEDSGRPPPPLASFVPSLSFGGFVLLGRHPEPSPGLLVKRRGPFALASL